MATTVLPRTIRRNELKQIVPLADSTIYEIEQRGEFPKRYALSPRCVAWDLAEVERWLAERRARPIERAQAPDVRQRRPRPVKAPDPAGRFPAAPPTVLRARFGNVIESFEAAGSDDSLPCRFGEAGTGDTVHPGATCQSHRDPHLRLE